jgi:hypothetical protein
MRTFLDKIPSEVKAVGLVFIAFFVVTMITTRKAPEIDQLHHLSTFENGMYGASKLKTLAVKSGFETSIGKSSFSRTNLNDVGIVFMLSPESSLKPFERRELDNWVNQGGILVQGYDFSYLVEPPKLSELKFEESSFPFKVIKTTLTDKNNELPVYIPPGSKGKENEINVIEPDLDQHSPFFRGVSKIQTPLIRYEKEYIWLGIDKNFSKATYNDVRLESLGRQPDESALDEPTETDKRNIQTLATYQDEPVIVTETIGKGQIIAIANPLIFANGFLEVSDNIMFAYNLMNSAPKGKTVLFDEYHHGAITEESIIATGWGRAVAFVLLVGILAIYSRAVRFIPPRASPPVERRSQVEYLRSLAQILRRAKATKSCAKIINRDLKNLHSKNDKIKTLILELEKSQQSGKVSESLIRNAINELLESEQSVVKSRKKTKPIRR